MSKHLKHVRRERKKTDRARRTRALSSRHPTSPIKHGAAAIVAAAVIASGTQAYASPVGFDNPAHGEVDHFHWAAPDNSSYLDWTLDAASQPGDLQNNTSLFQQVIAVYPFSNLASNYSGPNPLPQTQVDFVGPYALVEDVSAGTLIPSGLGWANESYIYSDYAFAFYGTGALLPENTPTYIGVRFDEGAGWQYGWIGVEFDGLELEAFAWGYETEPGVSIPAGVPEPGSLALLAMGAAGLARRRRR